jgi:hypothetical protein
MNIFLINPDALVSAHLFARLDPIRARKQLVECCQLLASVEHALTGASTMRRDDGQPYKAAHPHHPITREMRENWYQWALCYDVALSLAQVYRDHACTRTILDWRFDDSLIPVPADEKYLIVRRGYNIQYVYNRAEYARILRAYLEAKQ